MNHKTDNLEKNQEEKNFFGKNGEGGWIDGSPKDRIRPFVLILISLVFGLGIIWTVFRKTITPGYSNPNKFTVPPPEPQTMVLPDRAKSNSSVIRGELKNETKTALPIPQTTSSFNVLETAKAYFENYKVLSEFLGKTIAQLPLNEVKLSDEVTLPLDKATEGLEDNITLPLALDVLEISDKLETTESLTKSLDNRKALFIEKNASLSSKPSIRLNPPQSTVSKLNRASLNIQAISAKKKDIIQWRANYRCTFLGVREGDQYPIDKFPNLKNYIEYPNQIVILTLNHTFGQAAYPEQKNKIDNIQPISTVAHNFLNKGPHNGIHNPKYIATRASEGFNQIPIYVVKEALDNPSIPRDTKVLDVFTQNPENEITSLKDYEKLSPTEIDNLLKEKIYNRLPSWVKPGPPPGVEKNPRSKNKK